MQAVVRQESAGAPKEEDDKRFSHAQKMVSKLSEEVSEQKERLKHLGNGWCSRNARALAHMNTRNIAIFTNF